MTDDNRWTIAALPGAAAAVAVVLLCVVATSPALAAGTPPGEGAAGADEARAAVAAGSAAASATAQPQPQSQPPASAAPPLAPEAAAVLATVPKISAQELFARLGRRDMSLLVLDVRGAEEYAAGHVPGARNLPHDEVGARAGELRVAKDAGQQIVVYCRSGRRAALAIEALRKAGFEKLAHLEGDYMGWEAAGLEVARGRVASDAKGDSGATREPTPR